jgi:hypothetical protein
LFAIRIRQEPASFYKPDTLYEYIDGGADVYLLYDFQRLLHQNFRTPGGELTADIYDLGKPENAFGIYSAARFAPLQIRDARGVRWLRILQIELPKWRADRPENRAVADTGAR